MSILCQWPDCWQGTGAVVCIKWDMPIIFLCRCCCFFKRKKKKSGRQKWLAVVQCSPEREAVTLLRATSHSNSRDSVLNNPSNSEFARYPTPASVTWCDREHPHSCHHHVKPPSLTLMHYYNIIINYIIHDN